MQHRQPVPDRRQVLRHVFSHLLIPLLMCLGMGLAYQSAFHAPRPNHLKVAVIGTTPQAEVLAQTIKDRAGDQLDVTTLPSADAARQQLLNRDLVAAFTPDPAAPRLLVASANSDTSATAAERVFTEVADHLGKPLAVTDLAPTAKGDPTGQALFFLLVALSIGSYGSVAVLGAAGGALPMRIRALLCAGVSLAVSLIGAALAGPVFHLVDHDLAGLWALGWLYSAGIVAVGTALHTFLGRFTTLATMVLFVMLNFTSSGGIYRPDLQNGFYGALHAFWNGAGFLEGARNLVYFDGRAGFGGNLTVLAAWLLLGAALLPLAALTERRRRLLPAVAADAAVAPVAPVELVEPAEEEEIAEAVGV